MTLVRLQPWHGFDSVERHLSRLVDEAFSPASWTDFKDVSSVPAAELIQTEETIYLKLEVPGMEANDLDIQVTDKVVSVSGERKSEETSETDGVTRSEFRYGTVRRVIPLPKRVDNTQVTADYKDGILTLTLPKLEAEKSRVVKVNLEAAA